MRYSKKADFLEGIKSSTNITGSGFVPEYCNNNIEVSWYNVGVYFKRGMSRLSSQQDGRSRARYSDEELITY